MPLFFMISGYLYKHKNWLEFIVGKIRSLWLPYVVSSIVTSIVAVVMGRGIGIKNLIKIVLMVEPGPLLGAIWFLQVLFYAVILYDLITRVVRRLPKAEIVMSAITVVCLVAGILTDLPYHGSVIFNTVFFLHIGQMLKNHCQWKNWKLPMFIVLLGVCAGISAVNRTSYTTNTYTNPLLFIVGAVTGSVGIIGICRKVYRDGRICGVMTFIGENSMGPLIWQFVTFKIIIAIQILVYNLQWGRISDFPVIYEYASGIWVLLDVVIGIAVSILLYKVINVPVDKLVKNAKQRMIMR